MNKLIFVASVLAAYGSVSAQQSLIFTGRFPFVSLDAANERVGGPINRLDEFDFSYVTPGAGAFARSLNPSSAHHALMGDADSNGDYTKFRGFKTYFEAIQIGGLFVKHADKSAATARSVFWTVRDNVATKQIEVLTSNGTMQHVMRPGDWVRLDANGNAEFFMTCDQLDIAAGLPPAGQTSVRGAHAMCQDSMGNLYYSPVQGGHWVNGNGPTPIFANDGAIIMIDAANITYDANGNVAAFAPNSAVLLWEEVGVGTAPIQLSVRNMILNSASFDRTGAATAVTGFGKVSGLDLDPNGGTASASYLDSSNVYRTVPNLVFTSDAGAYAGTIWSTANNGSIAVINGVLCGSNTLGVPANGSWLGVALDVPNFQPTIMGLCIVNALPTPFVLDAVDSGAILPAAQQAAIEIDGQVGQFSLVQLLAAVGPATPGLVPGALRTDQLGFGSLVAAGSHPFVSVFTNPIQLGVQVGDINGYFTLMLPNFNNPALTGLSAVVQGGELVGSQIKASNPVLVQFK